MSKMEFLCALEAEKLTKQKLKQYCGTPCISLELFLRLCFVSCSVHFAEIDGLEFLSCWGGGVKSLSIEVK